MRALRELWGSTTHGLWNPVRSVTCGHLRAGHNHQIDPTAEWTDDDLRFIAATHNLMPHMLAALEAAELAERAMSSLMVPDPQCCPDELATVEQFREKLKDALSTLHTQIAKELP